MVINNTITNSTFAGTHNPGFMASAGDMIRKAVESDTWPEDISVVGMQTVSKDPLLSEIPIPKKECYLARYHSGKIRPVGENGQTYCHTSRSDWYDIMEALERAGAKPVGVYSARVGRRIMAIFEVSDREGFTTRVVVGDSFDGSSGLFCARTTNRNDCSNVFESCLCLSSSKRATLRHSASLSERVALLCEAIAEALEHSTEIAEAYQRAVETELTREQAETIFDQLFPPAADDASQAAETRAENRRTEGRQAMAMAVNNAGPTVATLWNAATWCVDRKGNGEARTCRGGASMLDAMVMGQRGRDVQKIKTLMIDVLDRDGNVVAMTPGEAVDQGAPASQVGRSILDSMLD